MLINAHLVLNWQCVCVRACMQCTYLCTESTLTIIFGLLIATAKTYGMYEVKNVS